MSTRFLQRLRNLAVGLMIAGCFVVVGMLAWSQLPQMTNGGLDNDHLIIFDHWHQLFAGSLRPWQWVFARIPSLFPDYGLGLILAAWIPTKHAPEFLTYYWVAQFGLIAALQLVLAWMLAGEGRRSVAVTAVALLGLLAAGMLPGYSFALMMAGLPVNHGGNAINTLGALAFFVAAKGRFQMRSQSFALLFAVGLLAGFSNRMFLLQFLPALGLVLLASRFCECRRKIWLALLAGSGFGGVVLYAAVIHQCADPTVGTTASRWLAALSGLGMLSTSGAWWVFVMGLAGSALILSRFPRDSGPGFLALFYISLVAVSLAVFVVLTPDAETVYLRYLLSPLLLSTVPLALALAPLKRPAYSLLVLAALASSSLLALQPARISRAAFPALDERHQWAVKTLSRQRLSHENVLAASPAWESRALALALGMPGSVLGVSTDGNPMLWFHSREEYLQETGSIYAPSTSQIRRFRYYLGSAENAALSADRLGVASAALTCYDNKSCLYRLQEQLDPSRAQFMVKFFSTQADDRYRCLNTDSNPAKRLLLKLRRGVRGWA